MAVNHQADVSFIPISERFGDFKNQIPEAKEILSFYSLSPTIYHISYLSKADEIKHISKLSGLTINTIATNNQVNESTYRSLITSAIKKKAQTVRVDQIKQRKNVENNEIPTLQHVKAHLGNEIGKKRLPTSNFQSLPFGFSTELRRVMDS